MNLLKALFLVVHFITSLLLFCYAANVLFMAIRSKKHRKKSVGVSAELCKEFPVVTIQLPLFNEKYVASRIIESIADIDWPKESLDIQVCDDSTDETLEYSKQSIAKLTEMGYDITLFHRVDRTGQKGGALREAMESAKGDYIAIFDADFVPAADFLKRTIPLFGTNSKLGMVQTRWGHLNPEYSPLTKAQAVAIDTHFMIEQVTRSGEKFYFNFNGTGGVWRKEAIVDAGNWQDDTITEDLDLSYRAQMRGWQFHYCHDVINPAELPVQLTAYKSQQYRWAKGSIQTAKKLLFRVLKEKTGLFKKFEAFLHLSYYMVHPLLLLNAVAFLPTLLAMKHFLNVDHFTKLGFIFTLLLLSIAPLTTLYSQLLIYPDWKKKITWIPHLVLFGTGLAVNNTRAVLSALMGKASEFIRTPKHGITGGTESWKKKKYKMPITIDAILELVLVVYLIGVMVVAAKMEMYYIIPFLFYYLLSFGSVFVVGLWQNHLSSLFQKQEIVPEPILESAE